MRFIDHLVKSVSGPTLHTVVVDHDLIFKNQEVIDHLNKEQIKVFCGGNQLDVRIFAETVLRGESERTVILIKKTIEILPDLNHMLTIRSIHLSDFFPLLSSTVLSGVSFSLLSELYIRQESIFEKLSFTNTIKFILESIYAQDLGTIGTSHKALAALITVVMDGRYPGDAIWKHLLSLAAPLPFQLPELFTDFSGWNRLFDLLSSSSMKDLNFLPVRKVLTLRRMKGLIQQGSSHPSVKVDGEEAVISRIETLTNFLNEMDETPSSWADLGVLTSEIKLWCLANEGTQISIRFAELEEQINNRFQQFLDLSYQDINTRSPYKRPFCVSHILPYLSFHNERPIVLIIIDGLNLWQARLLIDNVSTVVVPKMFTSIFAWLPTITLLSRQSICRGGVPDPHTDLYHEENLFNSFWQGKSYSGHDILFKKGKGITAFDKAMLLGKRVAGLIELDLDSILHGTVLGSEQLYVSTELFLKKSNFAGFIEELCISGFSVYITADHGNVEAIGRGVFPSSDKIVTTSRGARQVNFRDTKDLDRFIDKLPKEAFRTNYNFLFLKDNTAFIPEKTSIVTHGGSHLWEVLVPFIEFSR